MVVGDPIWLGLLLLLQPPWDAEQEADKTADKDGRSRRRNAEGDYRGPGCRRVGFQGEDGDGREPRGEAADEDHQGLMRM